MMAPIRLAAPAMILLGLAACAAPNTRELTESPFESMGKKVDQVAVISVRNHNCANAVAYLMRAGTRIRLGDVRSLGRRTFRVPLWRLGHTGVRVQVELLASRENYFTDEIRMDPGQRLDVRVEQELRLSSFMMFN